MRRKIDDSRPEDLLEISKHIWSSIEEAWPFEISTNIFSRMRAAISRAYYAVLLKVKRKYRRVRAVEGVKIHEAAAQCVSEEYGNGAGQLFMNLRSLRNQGTMSYPPEFHVSIIQVKLALDIADDLYKCIGVE